MCKIVTMNIDNRKIRVADIKTKYVENIIDAAKKCDIIDRIIMFGSSVEARCVIAWINHRYTQVDRTKEVYHHYLGG